MSRGAGAEGEQGFHGPGNRPGTGLARDAALR